MKSNDHYILIIILFSFCNLLDRVAHSTPIYPAFELQGHRGARGLAPENSLPAFHLAYRYGMTTIELDSTLTADDRLIIYHDPKVNRELCRIHKGTIPQNEQISSLKVSDLKQLDCGSIKHKRFPQQTLEPVSPPLLEEVLSLEKIWQYKPLYNLEIKVGSHYTKVMKQKAIIVLGQELALLKGDFPSFEQRLTIQSFDLDILKLVHKHLPHLRRSALFEPYFGSFENKPRIDQQAGEEIIRAARSLGVEVISPYEKFVTVDFVNKAHQVGLKVVPWTVNEKDNMLRLIRLGVDGLISDYPDRLGQVMTELGSSCECRTRYADSKCLNRTEYVYQRNELQALVDLHTVAPSIQLDIRYATSNNFIGQVIDGYQSSRCLLTRPASQALKRVQSELQKKGQSLKIFDCYRPQRAVNHFVRWASDRQAQKMKERYYPHLDKSLLFKEGYIAKKSGHSRGSTIDLTIVGFDMGSPWDLFDPISNTQSDKISEKARKNRQYLLLLMQKHGFQNYDKEWWHYTLDAEPFSSIYFDQVIE